jgi:hypothetical protein
MNRAHRLALPRRRRVVTSKCISGPALFRLRLHRPPRTRHSPFSGSRRRLVIPKPLHSSAHFEATLSRTFSALT